MEIKFKAKNDEEITLNIEQTDYLSIKAFNSQNKQIGFCNSKIFDQRCWLYKIQVTDQNYLGMGVGKKMLKALEKISKQSGAYCIEGKFYPEGNGAERALKFYNDNGYKIDYDGYEQMIFKSLFFEKDFEL